MININLTNECLFKIFKLVYFLLRLRAATSYHHMKFIILTVTFLLSVSLQAQEGFSASGGKAQGTAGSSSYTVGQTVYGTYTGSNGSVAQGVQQAYEIVELLGAEIAAIKLELVAYPNPTQETLTLKINNYKNESLTYQLYDLQGKLWDSQSLKGAQTQLEMNDLAVGSYLLSIQDEETLIKTFRIIKN